jgi:hypothetical protein
MTGPTKVAGRKVAIRKIIAMTAEPARHHGDHRNLVSRVESKQPPADLDAIVVPTVRNAATLRGALWLGGQLGTPVVALCSRWSKTDEAARIAGEMNARLIAADVTARAELPHFATSKLLSGTKFASHSDLSLKRNIGLAVSKMVGWRRVAFLDDDIDVAEPEDVRTAAGLVRLYNMVALQNVGFPDNSVVCHAIRRVSAVADVGVRQSSFVGGGAMVVPVDRTESFFPNIYNEDWFFMLSDKHIYPVAATGAVVQSRYDPYANPRRARAEEFGDCLAEGVYAILDNGGCIQDADKTYWSAFLDDRKQLIERVLGAVPALRLERAEHDRMVAALKAAQGRREFITPGLCVDYLEAWSADTDAWRGYLKRLPRVHTAEDALQRLGLHTRTVFRR